MARKNKHSNMQVGPDGLPVIDGFTVEEAIGEGGFSRVYRGTQDTPARPVAIKVFRTSGKVGARVRDRFKRESDVIGALSSEDGLVTVFTGGFTDSGAPYLAMELCDGGSVAGRISAHGGLPVGEVLAVGERIGSALAVVHGQQVAHRDVKPSNVLLKADGRAKLTDFGLSVVGEMTEPLGEESRLAVTEVYAPPERLNPGAEDGSGVDEAGDQYSFALTLYAMLLGGSPFTGETTTKRALKVLQGHIEPLIRQDIPPKLVHVLRRAMATRPEDRWPSMAELVAVLRTVAPNADTQSPEPLRPVASSTQAPSVTSKPRQQQFPALGASLADAPTNPTGMQEPPVMRTEVQNRPGASRSRLAAIGNRDHRNRPVPKEAATGHPVPFFTRALAHFGDVAPVPIAITGDGLVTAGQVTARLADLFAVPPDAIYFGDLRPSHDDPVQSLPGFHDGMITSTHSTHAAGGVSTDFEVLIDGGPAAGQVILLPVGQHVVGRDPSASIQIEDPQLNPLHFQVTLAADGMTFVQNFDSNAETLLEGRRLVGNVWVPEGARLFCGSSTISIRRLRDTTSRIAGSAEYEGTPQRSPARTYTNTPPVSLSRPPTVSSPPNGFTDVAAMTLGMATIFASALVMDNFVVAALVVLPPAGALISYRRRIRRFERSRRATWVDFSRMFADESEEFIRQKMEMADEQRRELPGPADVCQICSVPTHRLWGGRTTGNSHLRIRLGTQGKGLLDGGSLHARNHSWLQPVAAPLHEISSMGLVGPASAARASARFAVMQSAAHYGPQDLKVWAFLSEYCVEEWDFLRWLPHVQTDLGSPSLSVYVGRSSIREGIEKLQYLMHGRSELISAQSIPSSFADPAILAIFDTSDSGLDGEINRLLAGSQRLKVHGLVVAPDRTGVQFDALVKFDDATGLAQYEQHGGPPLRNVVFDGIAKHVAEGAARRLAALSVEEPRGLEIPTSVRLLDLLNLPEPTGDLIAERWQGSTRDLTRRKGVSSIVGHDGTGNVDLVLGQDLPNLLVAGAPGTGKSEFLLTLLAGLAAEQGPDDVRFIIIGFKGIQDFTIISKLPHTLDVVGNLGVRSFERAMRMMRNEVGRREIVLERAGAANIDAYRSMHRKGHQRAQQPLPRLIVIADEFAELKSQAPDQYDRLVSLTRLGRALGMHLILSTQSPAGVVNRQLEATIPVRISFKLIGPALSNEVIGDPAAGMLPMSARGRAFVSTQGASPVEVQMARVAGGRPDAAIEEPMLDVYPESLAETSQSHLRKAGSPFDPPDEETDLWGLMEACCDAAAKLGYAENSVPWAGPLPDEVLLSGSVDDEGHPVVGTVDDPDGVLSDRPIHRDYSIKLGEGHLCVFGTSGSGRSTALVSSAVALSLAAQPLHLFGIDNSNGGLSLLNELPNCGGLSPRDHQLSRRILTHLQSEVTTRHNTFESVGVANIKEYQGLADRLEMPNLLLAIDRLDSLVTEARSAEPTANAAQANLILIQKLLSEGSAIGLTVLASFGPVLPSGALMEHFRHRLLLRMSSRDDYSAFGISSSNISDEMIDTFSPGRALSSDGNSEVQFGVIGGPERAQQRTRISELDAQISRPADLPKIRSLPKRISWNELDPVVSLDAVPLGVDESANPVTVDLAEGRMLLVTGPTRSGRSTTLCSLIRLLVDAGVRVAVVAAAKSGVAADWETSAVEVWPPSDEPEDRYANVDVMVFDDADGLAKIREFDAQQAWLQFFDAKSTSKVISASADVLVDATGRVADALLQSDRLLLQPTDRFQAMEILGLNHTKADAIVGEYPPGRGAAVLDGELVSPLHVPTTTPRPKDPNC